MAIAPKQLEELGRAREGSLADAPFPVLLQALFSASRTATVELRQNHLVKHIAFEDGVPVDCTSNLLHETPGKFLVEKGKLDEPSYRKALNESVIADERIEQTLLRLQLVAPFELFKLLQQNLAFKILDCFCATWATARFKVLDDPPEVKQPLRLNLPQLVFTGASTFSPYVEVEAAVVPLTSGVLALRSDAPHPLTALKLAAKDARLIQELKRGAALGDLVDKLQLPLEDVLRKLYALHVLGYVAAREGATQPVPTPTPGPMASVPAPAAPTPVPAPALSDAETTRLRNEVSAAYLAHRSQDALDLLGLPESATPAQTREKFLAWSERFAPWKFRAGELASLEEKARDLFLAGARAYAQLIDPEQRALVLKRRANAREAATRKRSTDFSIHTDMLDAPKHYEEGLKRMQAGDPVKAVEFLEFASACDPRNTSYRVSLAHARFLASPKANEKQALAELEETLRLDPNCGEAQLVIARIHHALGRPERADEAYRKASKLMPGDRRAVEGMRQVAAERAKAHS